MNKESLKKNHFVRTLATLLKKWRDERSFVSGKGHNIVKKGVCVSSKIQILGGGNSIVLASESVLYKSLIKVNGRNNKVIVHKGAYLSGVELYIEDNGCTIEIGSRTFIGNNTHLACTEDGSMIKVGDHCMLSSCVQIRTGDSHSILDMDGNRINPAASVYIGDHCWLGQGCKVMKGVNLGNDSVVSTGAIVTKSFGNNVLVGGLPAKILKENINWDEKRL